MPKRQVTVVYATPLLKGWQLREACRQFREQEAVIRRQQFACVTQEAPTPLPSAGRFQTQNA